MEIMWPQPSAQWKSRPLCSKYLLVHFAAQPLRVSVSSDRQHWDLSWALGMLSDGQMEILGAWVHSDSGLLNWPEVFSEFAGRGLERVQFVVNADVQSAWGAFAQWKSLDSALPEKSGLQSRVLVLERRADETARLLQQGATQAIARHGEFESAKAAAAFAGCWLVNAERRLAQRGRAARRAPAVPAASVAVG